MYENLLKRMENAIMGVDLARMVDRFKVKSNNILLPIYEAITNSIDANANQISIIFHTKEDLTGKRLIQGIDVLDNGVGFTDENRKSFLELYSGYKAKIGGKGIGRLTFLKFFNEVKIQSHTTERDGTNNKINILFQLPFTREDIKVENTKNNTKTGTTIKFIDCRHKDIHLELDTIKERILEHFSILLFFKKEKNIQITLQIDDAVQHITNADIPVFKTKPFTIRKEKKNINNSHDEASFNINYIIDKDVKNGQIKGFYCAHERQVSTFKERGIDLQLPYSATFFVTSPYFDDRVNETREEFQIPDAPNKDMDDIFHFLSFEEIKEHLQTHLFNILKEEFPSIEGDNQRKIEEFKELYPELIGFIDEQPKGFFIIKDEKDKALKKLQKQKEDFDNLIKKKNVNTEEIIAKAEAIGTLDLVSYIKYRQVIIEQFAKYDLEQEKDEGKIHDIILKRKSSGNDYIPIPLKDNNLWLLDDKFMSYSFAASDKKLKDVLRNNHTVSLDEPDIAIYVNSENNPTKAILIELKKFNSNYKEGVQGLAQLRKYAQELKKMEVQEVYCYLIANIDENFRNDIKLDGYKQIFSQEGEIWQRYYELISTLVHIISPRALISDAKTRNRTFLDFIKNSHAKK